MIEKERTARYLGSFATSTKSLAPKRESLAPITVTLAANPKSIASSVQTSA